MKEQIVTFFSVDKWGQGFFRTFFLSLILLFPTGLSAQISDTVLLENIEILGIPTEKYASGSKIQQINSVARARLLNGSLQDLLQQETPLYLREYGFGMASNLILTRYGSQPHGSTVERYQPQLFYPGLYRFF